MPPEPTARPAGCAELFVAFTAMALQGFGGVMAVVQRELVERRRWLTREGFVEDWAVAQILPGPNVVNLALMLGDRHHGLLGALSAAAGLLLLPLVIVLVIALGFASAAHEPAVQGALRGMGAVAAGLIAATALKLLPALRQHPLGPWGCALVAGAGLLALLVARWPLAWVVLGIGGVACLWVYGVLGRPTTGGPTR